MTNKKSITKTSQRSERRLTNYAGIGKKVFAIGALGLMAGTLATSALAIDDESVEDQQNEMIQKHAPPQFMQEESVQEALDSGDYEAFIEAAIEFDENIEDNINEEKFEEILEKHAIHEEIQEAVENENYEAWIEAASKLPRGESFTQLIDEEEFSSFIEMHNLHKEGEKEAALEIAKELGLEEIREEMRINLENNRQEKHEKRSEGRQDHKQAVDNAIESGDYETFQELILDMPEDKNPFTDFDEADFEKLMQLHEARTNQDQETADQLAQELGLPSREEHEERKERREETREQRKDPKEEDGIEPNGQEIENQVIENQENTKEDKPSFTKNVRGFFGRFFR